MRGVTPADIVVDPPTLAWAKPGHLFVEDDYQRSLGESGIALIRRIVANWKWNRIKPVICVKVRDRLVVIDGQHTAIAAASHGGVTQVPVLIVGAETVRERAEAFIGQNRDRLTLTQMHMHYAALAAGEELAVAVDDACRKAGVTILRTPRGQKGVHRVGETLAVGTIARIVKVRGVHHGARCLKVLVEAKRAPLMAHEIAAVATLLFEPEFRGKIDVFDLVTALRSRSAAEWQARAAKIAADGMPRRKALAMALFNSLNRKAA